MHELTLENSYLERLAVVALHERHRPQHRRTQPQLADVFLNFPLALPMVDAGVPLRSSNGAVYEVLDPSLLIPWGASMKTTGMCHSPLLGGLNSMLTKRLLSTQNLSSMRRDDSNSKWAR